MSKPIQEQFGQTIIDAVNSLARTDLQSTDTIESVHLSHVGDAGLRRRLAESLYGARWIYKLGLALLVRDIEQLAHVRAQLVDYASVCEGILFDMIDHGMARSLLKGNKHLFRDPDKQQMPLLWTYGSRKSLLAKQSFYCFISFLEEEKIISSSLARRLQDLREERNNVHIRARNHKALLDKSREAFDVERSCLVSGTWDNRSASGDL